jgi:hypothetical protein
MTGKEEWFIEIGDTLIAPKQTDDFLLKENENNVILILLNLAYFYQKRYK